MKEGSKMGNARNATSSFTNLQAKEVAKDVACALHPHMGACDI
jgi:hypothetical protein